DAGVLGRWAMGVRVAHHRWGQGPTPALSSGDRPMNWLTPLAGNDQVARPLLDAQAARVQLLVELVEALRGELGTCVAEPALEQVVLHLAVRAGDRGMAAHHLEGLDQLLEDRVAARERPGAAGQAGVGPGDVQAAAQEAIRAASLVEQPDVVD